MSANEKYKALLIENSNGETIDTNAFCDIVVKSCPFQLAPEPKDYAVNDWADENGEDVYFPTTPVYKAYDLKVDFLCITENGKANQKIKSLWDFLQHPPLKLHDVYTNIGRQQVYYKSFNPKSFYRREGVKDIVEFSLNFRVCDPITDISLK